MRFEAVRLVFLALLAGASTAWAQQPRWAPSVLEDSLPSERLGEMRRVLVALPPDHDESGNSAERFPVLILVGADDELAFGTMLANLRLLEGPLGGAVPPLIVVGVLPTGRDESYPAGSTAANFYARGTRADAVAQFIGTELLPWLHARYRALPFTVIAGHSAPGHFSIFAFARYPEWFQAAVAVSPALWWLSQDDNDVALGRRYIEQIAARESGRLYITAGAYEPRSILEAYRRFVVQLDSAAPEVDVRHELRPADNHQTVRQAGFVDGVRWIFEPVSLSANRVYALMSPVGPYDTTALRSAYAETRSRYLAGARQLGLPERLPESYLNQMASLAEPVADTICADYVNTYPHQPWAHVCMARVVLAAGDTTSAHAHFRTALDAARTQRQRPGVIRWLEATVMRLDSALSKRK